jgi:hypothetical protein
MFAIWKNLDVCEMVIFFNPENFIRNVVPVISLFPHDLIGHFFFCRSSLASCAATQ